LNILIIEDEPRAARRLSRYILALRPDSILSEPVTSIESAKCWLFDNPQPDLIFLDIRLEDGDAFSLLDKVDIPSPIVFCTAYSEYSLTAFQVNSLDYILKPIREEDLKRIFAKYDRLVGLKVPAEAWRYLRGKAPIYRSRFLVKNRMSIRVVPVSDVVIIEAYLKAVKLITRSGEEIFFDESFGGVLQSLDPALFFQVSRQHAVRLSEVAEISKTGRCAVVDVPAVQRRFEVSRSRLKELQSSLEAVQPCDSLK